MTSVHCVGIGGIGISAIARVLLERGYRVSGSDLRMSPVAQALAEAGATVSVGHDAAHVGQVDMLLVSSAVPEDNVEVLAARQRGIPVFKRAGFLGRLMTDAIGIAVAGTAGKTTTTAMLVWILTQAGLDPTFIVGGVIGALHTNAHAGRGPHFVVEADEYERMFLGLAPTVAAVTHLAHDHPDCYPTFADVREAFAQFLDLVPADGLIVGCGDHPTVVDLLAAQRRAPVQTCGLDQGNDWRAGAVRANDAGGHDVDVYRARQRWGCVRLAAPGLHDVQNALVALAIADWLGVERAAIVRALGTYAGVGRRFEVLGEAHGVAVVDDYAHHPDKIVAALSAAQVRYPGRPVWAVWEPHTYSRTRALWDEFVSCFGGATHVIVLDVYPARETDAMGVDAARLARAIAHPDAQHVSGFDAAVEHLLAHVEPNAVVVTLSAGDGNQVGLRLLAALHERAARQAAEVRS
ncbi:MAG: UDP-N-acetylmuramate--L-alanine ligase [Anaerolineae bacterium]|nr:UDP-N-acetylmuramate--L-alanine ligase [Anaerolineae bacterium]